MAVTAVSDVGTDLDAKITGVDEVLTSRTPANCTSNELGGETIAQTSTMFMAVGSGVIS